MAPTLRSGDKPNPNGVRPGSERENAMQALAKPNFTPPLHSHSAASITAKPGAFQCLVKEWLDRRELSISASDNLGEADAAALAIVPPYPEDAKRVDERNASAFAEAQLAAGRRADAAALPRPNSYYLWCAQLQVSKAAHGLADLEQASARANALVESSRDRVFAEPASSIYDVTAKVAILSAHLKDGWIDDEAVPQIVQQIHSDLVNLSRRRGR